MFLIYNIQSLFFISKQKYLPFVLDLALVDFQFLAMHWIQGTRKYSPLQESTAQKVMIDTISAGRTTVFLLGAHTNFALFLMSNPHLKRNIEHIYVMGGGVRSKNPTGCCPENASITCTPQECGDRGNLYTAYASNPYAEFNIFGDPFSAYQVYKFFA